jgi:hypothetical protein
MWVGAMAAGPTAKPTQHACCHPCTRHSQCTLACAIMLSPALLPVLQHSCCNCDAQATALATCYQAKFACQQHANHPRGPCPPQNNHTEARQCKHTQHASAASHTWPAVCDSIILSYSPVVVCQGNCERSPSTASAPAQQERGWWVALHTQHCVLPTKQPACTLPSFSHSARPRRGKHCLKRCCCQSLPVFMAGRACTINCCFAVA